MKRTLILSAVALSTLAGAASAMTATTAEQAILERYAPNIDVSELTNAQVATLMNVVNSNDSAGDKRRIIRNLVN